MWFIGVEVEQETSATPPKKNPGSAPESEVIRKPRGKLSISLQGRGEVIPYPIIYFYA